MTVSSASPLGSGGGRFFFFFFDLPDWRWGRSEKKSNFIFIEVWEFSATGIYLLKLNNKLKSKVCNMFKDNQ